MQVKIEFVTDNAAFEDNPLGESARVMDRVKRAVIELLESDGGTARILDTNGNTVGTVEVS